MPIKNNIKIVEISLKNNHKIINIPSHKSFFATMIVNYIENLSIINIKYYSVLDNEI